MCDEFDFNGPSLYQERTRTARKESYCSACFETIAVGHRYHYIFGKWDGDVGEFRHCMRCSAIFTAIEQARPGIVIDLALACGETWQDALGVDPPEHVAVLAFVLPGEMPESVGGHP
jgi:hypothetical protein